ncbi:cell division cycle protein 16 homolog [Styela clava]
MFEESSGQTMEDFETNPELINRLRALVRQYREKRHYQTALFWADKVASLSKYEIQDIYNLAQCMYSVGEYERAALFIKGKRLHEKHSAFRYLAAKCYAEAKEWQLALDLLEDATFQVIPRKLHMETEDVPGIPTNKEMKASILLLKGDIYEAKDTRQYAAQCYEEALLVDVFCYEAYDRIIAHHLLFPSGEQELLESLPLNDQCKSEEERQLVSFLYGTKIRKYDKPTDFKVPKPLDNLHENLEVATSIAERLYYNSEFKTGYKFTSGILRTDPYHTECLPLHIAFLVVLRKSNELFYLSHKLVKRYPEKAISWYSVGCYYLLQPKKQELTRRYLLKATLIDKMFGPAWLALGHSFALEGEHDQAMAAYFTATQLMRGSHLPYLYSGIEYSVTNNLTLTDKFFDVALFICPDDPHTLHEIGVANYTLNKYPAALKYFNKALEVLKENEGETISEEWEALLNNLAHVHRKMKNYQLALKYHQQALILAPQSAQTYSSIGFVLSFMGRYSEALEYLHKALGLQRDDVFAVNLIEHVIEQYSESEPAFFDGDNSCCEDDTKPPPFREGFGMADEDQCEIVDHNEGKQTEPMESSVHTSPTFLESQSNAESGNLTKTTEKDNVLVKNILLEEGAANAFQTPEEYMLGRPLPPVLRGLKKTQVKSRRVVSSPAPLPIDFAVGTEGTPSAVEGGDVTPVLPPRKMLSLASSESSDDGGVSVGGVVQGKGDAQQPNQEEPRSRALSTEDPFSTSVLKGGGRGFETTSAADIPGVSDSVIMMLGDSVASASDTSIPSTSGSHISMPEVTSPEKNRRTRNPNESSDMEMDDTLD